METNMSLKIKNRAKFNLTCDNTFNSNNLKGEFSKNDRSYSRQSCIPIEAFEFDEVLKSSQLSHRKAKKNNKIELDHYEKNQHQSNDDNLYNQKESYTVSSPQSLIEGDTTKVYINPEIIVGSYHQSPTSRNLMNTCFNGDEGQEINKIKQNYEYTEDALKTDIITYNSSTINNLLQEDSPHCKITSQDNQMFYEGHEDCSDPTSTLQTEVILSAFTDEDRFKTKIYIQNEVKITSEESKFADEDQQIFEREFKLYKFDYNTFKWKDTMINFKGLITHNLHRYQYLYIEKTEKVMFLGLTDECYERSNPTQKVQNWIVDSLGSCCAQMSIKCQSRLEFLPSFPTAKSRFASVKVESHVFVIGGNDDLRNCFQYDLNAKNFQGQLGISDSWCEVPKLNVGRYSTSVCCFDHRFIYLFGGRANYGVYLNSIEVLDTQVYFASTAKQNAEWKMISIILPQNMCDSFCEQIESQKIIILGGKIKSQK